MKNILLILTIFLYVPTILSAQTAEEIIEKHIKAHGGSAKWKAVKTMEITGQFTAYSEKKDFKVLKAQNSLYYGELYYGKNRVIEVWDGKAGWTIDQWYDIDFPRRTNKDENNVLEQRAELCTPFFDYKEKGHKVEFVEKTELDGIEVYVLKLTRASGYEETWYLNAKTYLEYKRESMWQDWTWANPSETFFDDFRTVEGLVIPFFVEIVYEPRILDMNIEEVKINTEIEMTCFEFPRSEKMQKLEFLEGEWDVDVAIWSMRSNIWYPIDSTTSTINFDETNILEEKISYPQFFPDLYTIFPISKTINYTYNKTMEKYRISIFSDYSSSLNIYEGEFIDNNFVADNTKISFSEEIEENKTYTQLSFNNIGKDGFVLEISNSTDKGTTWIPKDKFTYKRHIE